MNPMVQFTLRAARGAVEHFLRVRERIENAHEEFNLDRLLEDTARKAVAAIRPIKRVKAKVKIPYGKLNRCTATPTWR
jgi:5-methylcytosine-specific restriction endonuclease McrBC regulatory subunit McrC